jgi:hypothetical protein
MQSCVAGMCEDKCGAAPCPTGETCGRTPTAQFCGTPCGSPTSQPCSPGQVCTSGSCVTPSCGGTMCFPGQSCVGGTTCENNCGSGGPCSAGQLCVYGACQAAPFTGLADFSLVDVDGDSQLDLVGTEFPQAAGPMASGLSPGRTANLVVIRQTAPGAYGTPVIVPLTSTTGSDALDVLAVDFTGDNKPDLVASYRSGLNMGGPSTESYTLVYLPNDGAGNFSTPTSALGTAPGRPGFSAGNLDGNGQLDLAVVIPNQSMPGVSLPSSNVSIFYDLGAGAGTPATVAVDGNAPAAYADCGDATPLAMRTSDAMSQLVLGDLNGDGKADLFVGQWVYLSKGTSFGAPGRIEGGSTSATSANGGSSQAAGGIELPLAVGPLLVDLGSGHVEAIAVDEENVGGPSGVGNTTLGLQLGQVNPAGVHTW